MAGPRGGPAARTSLILCIAVHLLLSCAPAPAASAAALASSGAEPDGGAASARVLRRRLLAVPDTQLSLAQPSNCTPWLPQKRVYVESQAWFTRCAPRERRPPRRRRGGSPGARMRRRASEQRTPMRVAWPRHTLGPSGPRPRLVAALRSAAGGGRPPTPAGAAGAFGSGRRGGCPRAARCCRGRGGACAPQCWATHAAGKELRGSHRVLDPSGPGAGSSAAARAQPGTRPPRAALTARARPRPPAAARS